MDHFITYKQLKKWGASPYCFQNCKKYHKGDGFYLNNFLKSNSVKDLIWLLEKLNRHLIDYILTIEIQLAAVNQDGDALQYFPNAPLEVQLAAVNQNGYALRYCPNAPLEVQLAAVNKDGYALRYCPRPLADSVKALYKRMYIDKK